jgi:hypothetical protein
MTGDYERGYADGMARGQRVVADPARFPMRTASGHPPVPERYRMKPPPPAPEYEI